jgi:hypothetical protein
MEQQPHQPWQGAQPPGGSPAYSPPPYAQPHTQPVPYQGWPPHAYQPVRDAEHLKILSICHYVWGAISTVFSMCGLMYVFMGLAFTNDPSFFNNTNSGSGAGGANQPPPEWFGYMMVGMGTVVVLLGSLVGGLTIYSGRCIARRRNRTFSMAMAGVNCLSMPVGTVLGVFTFMVLTRDSVRALYTAQPPGAPGPGSRGPYA